MSLQILGVNERGEESANALVVSGRTCPWLQETSEERVWEPWGVRYRDVVILDRSGKVRSVYNLTDHSLGDAASYAALKQLFLDAGRLMQDAPRRSARRCEAISRAQWAAPSMPRIVQA